jgi:hypothetical protein
MVRKILSDLLSGLRADFVSGARDGIAWGLAMSTPGPLTLWLLEPLAAEREPRQSFPPRSDVVVRGGDGIVLEPAPRRSLITRGGDRIAAVLFLVWHWEMSLRAGPMRTRFAARASARKTRQLYAVRGGL